MHAEKYDIAVLILSFRKKLADVKRFLDSIYTSVKYAEKNGIKVRVFVLDYGSDSEVCQYMRSLGFCVIKFSADPGASAMRNYAIIRFCRNCRYIITVDDDVLLSADSLLKLVNFMDEYGVDIAQPLVLNLNGTVQSKGLYHSFFTGKAFKYIDDIPQPVMYTSGCCSIIRLKSLMKIGLYDDVIRIQADDLELGLRGWLNGLRVYYAPVTRVIHVSGFTWRRKGSRRLFHKFFCWMSYKTYATLKLFGKVGGFGLIAMLLVDLLFQFVLLLSLVGVDAALGMFSGLFHGIKLFIKYGSRNSVSRKSHVDCMLWRIIQRAFIAKIKFYMSKML